MRIDCYIAGQLVNPPKNIDSLEIAIRYREVREDGQAAFFSTVTNNKWIFTGPEAEAINEIRSQGFMFEGIPMQFKIVEDGETEVIFDGYIDMTDDFYSSCGEVHVTTKEKQGRDWLAEVADGITFEKMFEDNPEFFKEKFIYPPYTLNSTPNWREAMSALISCFTTVITLVQMVKEFVKTVTDFTGELWWAVILKILMEAAYITVLAKICIDQTQNFINYLIQPTKYLCGMRYKDLFQAIVIALSLNGYEAEAVTSGPLAEVVRIPESLDPPPTNQMFADFAKNQENVVLKWFLKSGTLGLPNLGTEARILGYTAPHEDQRGYYKGTVGDFLREYKLLTNSKIVMSNGVLKCPRRDKATGTDLYQIPNIKSDWIRYNTGDFSSNIRIKFSDDSNDKNTADLYQGTAFNIHHELKVVNNPQYKLLTKGRLVDLPVVLGKRKTELSIPEKVAKVLFPFVEKWLNHAVDFANFHIGTTWNFFVDLWEWITDFFENVVDFLVGFIEDALNAIIDVINNIIDAIHDFIQAVVDVINNIIGVVNTLSGGSIGSIGDVADWGGIGEVDFGPDVENFMQFLVASSLSGIVAPFFGILMSDPHTLIIGIMDLLGLDIPQINEINKFEIPRYDEDRINMMVMENDYLYKPRVAMLTNIPSDGPLSSKIEASKNIRLHPSHEIELSAKRLWERFYHIDAFARTTDETTGQTVHNQFQIKEYERVTFCFSDFQKVKDDDIALSPTGQQGVLYEILWRPMVRLANIIFAENKEYVVLSNGENNFKLQLHEPGN